MDLDQLAAIKRIMDEITAVPMRSLPAHAILMQPVRAVLEALVDATVVEVAVALAKATPWPPDENTPTLLIMLEGAAGAVGIRGGVSYEDIWCVLRDELQGVPLRDVMEQLQMVAEEMGPIDYVPNGWEGPF